jgi:hypothetical protein
LPATPSADRPLAEMLEGSALSPTPAAAAVVAAEPRESNVVAGIVALILTLTAAALVGAWIYINYMQDL